MNIKAKSKRVFAARREGMRRSALTSLLANRYAGASGEDIPLRSHGLAGLAEGILHNFKAGFCAALLPQTLGNVFEILRPTIRLCESFVRRLCELCENHNASLSFEN